MYLDDVYVLFVLRVLYLCTYSGILDLALPIVQGLGFFSRILPLLYK